MESEITEPRVNNHENVFATAVLGTIPKKAFTKIRKVNLFNNKSGKRTKELSGSKAGEDGESENTFSSDYYESNASDKMASKKAAAGGAGAAAGAPKLEEQKTFQIEIETEMQWRALLRREGLIVCDVYAGWAGPCASMISILKRIKVEVNDDRLWMAIACSDNITDLLMFKDQSEPTWLFIGGGKPVRVFRGAHAPKLTAIIKQEFQKELLALSGKARRTLISIDDEVSRRKKAENEALRLAKMVKEEDTAASDLNELRRESSVRLMQTMEPYTVLVVQPFLLETGAVTEIRDSLQGEFKIEQEKVVTLDEEQVRQLYRIPYEIPDPNYVEEPPSDEMGDNPPPEDDEAPEEEAFDEEGQPIERAKPKKKGRTLIPVPLPEGIVGDTLIMLLECLDLKKMMAAGARPDPNSPLQSADDYILIKVGPINHKDALEHAPYSFHALYGRAEYAPGVWCPRRDDDKRFVLINYFPRFVTEMLMPAPAGTPKYMVALYKADVAGNVKKEIESHQKDVLAEEKLKVPADLAESMLKSWNNPAPGTDEFKKKKSEMTSGQVFALSVNRKNSALVLALQGLNPLHISLDNGFGKMETSKLFKKLNIPDEQEPDPDAFVEKFLSRGRKRIEPVVEEPPPPPPKPAAEGGDEEETTVIMPPPPAPTQAPVSAPPEEKPIAPAEPPTAPVEPPPAAAEEPPAPTPEDNPPAAAADEGAPPPPVPEDEDGELGES